MSDAPEADDAGAETGGAGPPGASGEDGDATAAGRALTAEERERLAALSEAESLADLVTLTGAKTEHEAYLRAKAEWSELWRRRQEWADLDTAEADSPPGETVTVDGVDFHVHGVTHAGTDAERSYLREHVSGLLDAGAVVYAEQGLRGLFFRDQNVCEMDDYRWALERCEDVDGADLDRFDEALPVPSDRLDELSNRVRTTAYTLIEDYSDVYGKGVERTLGSLASAVLTDHEGLATGEEYEAFALRQQAVADPTRLGALQAYYRRSFLPQPVEREWVRRHDPDLEWVTHGRNARMADYAVHHADGTGPVHLIVGAAHGPGVAYYLQKHRDGGRSVADFELA